MSFFMPAKRRPPLPLPLMLAELAFASWETVAHRTAQMALGTCTRAEYRRMVAEKARAAHESTMALFRRGGGLGLTAGLAPWHRRARANARRLRGF